MLTGEDIIEGENLDVLPALPDGRFDLIYIDPPFNTGKPQVRRTLEVVPGDERTGFAGRRYASRVLSEQAYDDAFDDYVGVPAPAAGARAAPARRRTGRSTSTSTRARRTTSRSCSTSCSGASASSTRSSGPTTSAARTKRRWPAKHDTILVYVRDPAAY